MWRGDNADFVAVEGGYVAANVGGRTRGRDSKRDELSLEVFHESSGRNAGPEDLHEAFEELEGDFGIRLFADYSEGPILAKPMEGQNFSGSMTNVHFFGFVFPIYSKCP